VGPGLNSCDQEQEVWRWRVLLVLDWPGQVDIEGRCVLGSDTSIFKWVVGWAWYDIWDRESNGVMGRVVVRTQVMPWWLVGCLTLV